MSRSVMMPSTVAPSSLTISAPICWSRSSRAAVAMLVRGGVVATVEPLTLRIDATFIRHLRAVDAMSSQDTTQESLSVFRRASAFEPARAPSRRSDSAERR